MREVTETELDELLTFVEGLRTQMKEVSALKMQYAEEDKAQGYLMPWKRAVGDRHVAPSVASAVSTEARYAPELSAQEMEVIYEGLPEGWFHISVAARMLRLTGPEMRRRFYWMSKRKYVMYSNALQLFRKRVGVEKLNYTATSQLSGPFASNLPRTEKKVPTFVT